MFDVFISHSSYDKESIVKPLFDNLTKRGLQVWYDNNNINKGDNIKEEIISGINESVVFVAVITENFFKSNWASLELGILQCMSPNNLIPLVSKDVKEIASQKYPFLFDRNYIEISNNESNIVDELLISVNRIKQECGLWHINKTNLRALIKEMRTYNDFKLDQLAIQLNSLVKGMNNNYQLTTVNTKSIIENILKDVASKENIYLNEYASAIDLFLNIDFLNANLKEHIKFVNKINENNANRSMTNKVWEQPDLYLIQFSVFSIIEWYMLSYFKKPLFIPKTIIQVSPEEISFDDILQSYEIEKLVLPSELIATPSIVKLWHEHNPLTFIGARDATSGKLIGFFNTLPITDSLYEQILSGNFDDTHFDIDNIRPYDLPGFYKLYLCSFCIHPAYNTTSAFKVIYDSFIDFLLNLAVERDIFISDIIADGVTQKGACLCESIGMSKIKTTNHNSFVYSAKLIPPECSSLKLNNIIGRRLIAYYKQIYTEYKNLF